MKRYGTVICILLWGLCSCTVTRQNHTLVTHDTITHVQVVHDTLHHVTNVTNTEYIHDTVIKLPGAAITETFTAADLKPNYNYSGRKVAKVIRIDTGTLHAVITIDTNQRITVALRQDSTRLVIANLIERNNRLRDSLAHTSTDTTLGTVKQTSAQADTTSVIKTFWGRYWKWIVVIIAITIIIIEILAKLKILK
jgi:hypothetical protein